MKTTIGLDMPTRIKRVHSIYCTSLLTMTMMMMMMMYQQQQNQQKKLDWNYWDCLRLVTNT